MKKISNISSIGLDADDTLWINETYFRESEDHFCRLMSAFETENKTRQELLQIEIKNLEIYGYGIKGFILSMLECGLKVSNNTLSTDIISKILNIGKDMLNQPVDLLPGVKETLSTLKKNYRLLLITKGDLLDQEKKVVKSGLEEYFHHVEVLSNKHSKNYKDLLDHLSIPATEFLMVGNSLKSDILPLLEIGARAIHIPFHTTWEHENVDHNRDSDFITLSRFSDLLDVL